jgi:hypothetical protein
MDRHPMDQDEFKILETINEVLSWCFFTEMMLKMCGLGLK